MERLISDRAYNQNSKSALKHAIAVLIKMRTFSYSGF